ncbi:MAG TPA: hypothetical protein VKZ41_00310 [Gemmatimonadales bacterium]|nr:hypothetical protein [Gemmatimonadales bacterium]
MGLFSAIPAVRLNRESRRQCIGLLALLVAVLLLAVAPASGLEQLRAQEPDTVRVTPPSVLLFPDSTPPISPGRAFFTSLAVPGVAQSKLQRPNAAALFTAAEIFSVGMLAKSLYDYRVARNFERDSVVLRYATDPVTGEVQLDPGTGLPIVAEWTPGRYSTGLVRARKLHVEDWIAALALNHLLSAIDAYVAANLWDLPVDMEVSSSRRGTVFMGSIRW